LHEPCARIEWSRALSDAEVESLKINPYQFFSAASLERIVVPEGKEKKVIDSNINSFWPERAVL